MADDVFKQKDNGKFERDASFDELESIITRAVTTRQSYEKDLEKYKARVAADADSAVAGMEAALREAIDLGGKTEQGLRRIQERRKGDGNTSGL